MALSGGAMHLVGRSSVISDTTHLKFIGNKSHHSGGALCATRASLILTVLIIFLATVQVFKEELFLANIMSHLK